MTKGNLIVKITSQVFSYLTMHFIRCSVLFFSPPSSFSHDGDVEMEVDLQITEDPQST